MHGSHGMSERDAPRCGRRGELRQRVPRTLPRRVQPEVARALIDAAVSWRDTALLTLLWRTGQRIGDWSETHGQHVCSACGWVTWTGAREGSSFG